MTRFFILSIAAAFFTSCASMNAPLLTAENPASQEAPEGARVARHTSLRADETTLKSRALLSAAQKEQKKWDDYGPVSGTAEDAPKTDDKMDMKNMNHEAH